MQSQETGDQTLEAAIHKLKLLWMMAKDDAEKRRISEEIRDRMRASSSK